MQRNGSITSMQAFDHGITRLADVIYKIKKKGVPVNMELRTGRNRNGAVVSYAVYSLGERA